MENEIIIDYLDFIKMWNTLYNDYKDKPEKVAILVELKDKIFLRNELYKDEIYNDEKDEKAEY